MFPLQPAGHFAQHNLSGWMIGPAHDIGPDRPRIIDIDVDVVLRERAEYHCRAQATANGRAMSRPFQALPNTVSEERKSVVWGKGVAVRVDRGGGRIIKKTK